MTGCKYIDDYIGSVLSGARQSSARLKKACRMIDEKLSDPDVFIDNDMAVRAAGLIEKYFGYTLFDWQLFLIGLVHCYYKSTDTVVFAEYLIMMGRGNGKNGFISGLVWYLSSKAHGISGYNVDIIANSEDQAEISFMDIYEMLDRTWSKSHRFFTKTKEIITNKDTHSYIKYNTSSAKTKDGKRSACLIFDEIHEYENSDRIRVFRSGFGKVKHSREFYITTNGNVREGVLDDRLRIANDVLNGVIPNSRLCPLIWELDSDEEADHPELWEKANPSISYLPILRQEIEKNYAEKDYDQTVYLELFTKRFNRPRANRDLSVCDYDKIAATNKPLEMRHGSPCTVGIDYAELSDWASVNLHFRDGDIRYDLNHAWICRDSSTLSRIKAPWQMWCDKGLCTFVEDVTISPAIIAEYIADMGREYNVRMLAMDNFRWTAMADALRSIGFDASDKKRVKLVRPSDIMRIDPIVQMCFSRGLFAWGDNPCLRWATNNTKRVRSSQRVGYDTGNYIYAKIEGKSRKTDPFMALVASMTCEDVLGTGRIDAPTIGAIAI